MIHEILERFFVQSWLSFKALFGWIEPKMYIFVKVINPIFQLIFFCLLAKYCYNVDDLTPWVIGNSFLLCIYNTIFGIGSVFMVERYYGTLKMVIASPSNKFFNFFQRGFVHIIDSLFTVIIGLVVGKLLFNVNFENVNIGLLLLIIVIAMFSAVGFGLFIGSLGLIISEMNLVMNICAMLLLAFSGANFPVDDMLKIFQVISNCLPITRSISLTNLLIEGQGLQNTYHLLIEEIAVGIIYAILGYILIKVTETLAKKKASLDVY